MIQSRSQVLEGTASTRELTLFFSFSFFFFFSFSRRLRIGELGVAFEHYWGVAISSRLYFEGRKSGVGYEETDRMDTVSVSGLRRFGVSGLDDIVGLTHRGSGNYIPNRAVLTAFTLFTTTDQPAKSTTACVSINCVARSEFLSRWRHLSCRCAYPGNGLEGNLQGFVYAHKSASEKECVYIRRKHHKKTKKKDEDKNGISRGSRWIKVRVSYLSCLSFVLVWGKVSVWDRL